MNETKWQSLHPLAKYEKSLLSVVRMDLQLHFFWSFVLTISAILWNPLIFSGLLITVLKECFDIIAQKGWSWGDFICGVVGFVAGLLFLNLCDYL